MNVGKNKTFVYATPNYNTLFGIAQERSVTELQRLILVLTVAIKSTGRPTAEKILSRSCQK